MRQILFLFLALTITIPAFAQNNSEKVLQLTHKKKSKQKYIKIGRKVKIKTSDKKYKGRIDSIAPGMVYVDGEIIKTEDVEKLRIKMRGTQISGAIVGTGGLLFTGLGLVLLVESSKTEFLEGKLILFVGGFLITGAGAIVTTIGTSVFLIGKSYKSGKWKYETVELIK